MLTITALALVSAAAAGVMPVKSGFFGGGTIGTTYKPGYQNKLAWINLSVAKDGKSFTIYGDWNASCQGFGPPARASFAAQGVRPKADGSFVAVGELSASDTIGHYAVSGKFLSPTSASGSGDSEFTFTNADGKSYSCKTGFVNWQARADAQYTSAAGQAAPKAGAGYYGNTSGVGGRLPFTLRVSADGKSVEQAAVLMDAQCKQDPKLYLHVDPLVAKIRIQPGGLFVSNPRYADNVLAKPGQTVQVASHITGRFGKSAVVGTWHVEATILDAASGSVVDTCSSSLLRYKADL
jgi:hypothetical protein